MAVTLTNADQALKSVYLDAVREQLNFKINPFLTMINRTSNDVWGKDIRKTVLCGMNGGIKAGTETGDLPVSSGAKYETLTLSLKNFYGNIEISDKALRASENNVGAFVNLLNAEMETLIKSCTFNFGRMLFGDGSGKLATVTDVTDKKITVNSVKNLMEGMIVDILNPLDGEILELTGRRIMSIDRENNTVVLDRGNGIVPMASSLTIQDSLHKELTGLEAIFTNSELYGLKKSEHGFLNPYVKKKQGKITETALQKAIDKIEENAGGEINYIVCSYGVKRALQNLFTKKNINTDTIELAGGYKSISYNGIPIVADRFCPEGTLYLLNTHDFELHQLCDWTWLESGDGSILKQIPGKPVYSATLVKYADLLCSKPCGQGKICGITEE